MKAERGGARLRQDGGRYGLGRALSWVLEFMKVLLKYWCFLFFYGRN